MFSCPNFCGIDIYIDRINGNVEHNKLSASNVLNILPNDWETIKINTDLFIKTGSTYRINTSKWNQVVSTLIEGTEKDVTIICSKNSNSGHSSKATISFSSADLMDTNTPRDEKYKCFRFESFDFFTLNISSCLAPNNNNSSSSSAGGSNIRSFYSCPISALTKNSSSSSSNNA